jgi:hypothetical protein
MGLRGIGFQPVVKSFMGLRGIGFQPVVKQLPSLMGLQDLEADKLEATVTLETDRALHDRLEAYPT